MIMFNWPYPHPLQREGAWAKACSCKIIFDSTIDNVKQP